MKKFLSTILAVVMVLSSMAMVVSADETLADGIYVGTTKYDTFTAAQTAAAATTAKEIIISGTVEFGSRQGISVEGLHLRGINDAKIIPSASYGDANNSATNKKGLLNIGANNVTVTDVTFDGSVYGDTISQSTDFIVLRINSGTGIELDGVTVKGSPKTLISIGTTTSSAYVTASDLVAEAEVKSLLSGETYADIDVVSGTFDFQSGTVDGFIGEDVANTYTVTAPGHFTFTDNSKRLTVTPKHLVASYDLANILTYSQYVDLLADNDDEATKMAKYIRDNKTSMEQVATDMRAMFVEMQGFWFVDDAEEALLQNYIDIIDGIITD